MKEQQRQMPQAATAEVRLDPAKSAHFSSSVPSNDRLAASTPAAGTIYDCPNPPKGKSLPGIRRISIELSIDAIERTRGRRIADKTTGNPANVGYVLHTKSEWVDWDSFHELGLPQQEVGRYLKELHDLGLAEGKFVPSGENNEYADIGVRIRARGADAVENPEKRPPEVVIAQNTHSPQNVTLDMGKLNVAIDKSAATLEEKTEAKSLLQRLNGSQLLTSLLQKWFSGHLPN